MSALEATRSSLTAETARGTKSPLFSQDIVKPQLNSWLQPLRVNSNTHLLVQCAHIHPVGMLIVQAISCAFSVLMTSLQPLTFWYIIMLVQCLPTSNCVIGPYLSLRPSFFGVVTKAFTMKRFEQLLIGSGFLQLPH